MVADVRLVEDRIGFGAYVAAPHLPFVTPHARFAGAAEATILSGMLQPARSYQVHGEHFMPQGEGDPQGSRWGWFLCSVRTKERAQCLFG